MPTGNTNHQHQWADRKDAVVAAIAEQIRRLRKGEFSLYNLSNWAVFMLCASLLSSLVSGACNQIPVLGAIALVILLVVWAGDLILVALIAVSASIAFVKHFSGMVKAILGNKWAWPRALAMLALLCATNSLEYDQYVLIRFIVCAATVHAAFRAKAERRPGWAWVMALLAVLFNPFLPMHLTADTWRVLDWICAGIIGYSLFSDRKQGKPAPSSTLPAAEETITYRVIDEGK